MELSTTSTDPEIRGTTPITAPPESDEVLPEDQRLRAAEQKLGDPSTGHWGMVATLAAGDVVGVLLLLSLVEIMSGWVTPEFVPLSLSSVLLGGTVLIGAFGLAGFYKSRFIHPAHEMKEMALLVGMMAVTAVLTSIFLNTTLGTIAVIGIGGTMGALVAPLIRGFTRVLGSRFSWWGAPAVVVSLGSSGKEVVDTLHRWPEIGLRPVALLTEEEGATRNGSTHGDTDVALDLAQSFDIPHAIVSLPEHTHPERAKLLAHYSKFFDHVFSVSRADSPVFWTTGCTGKSLRGYGVSNAASSPVTQGLKRAIDLLGAALVLALSAPFFATIAALIRLGSEGPVFYRQERLGKGGEVFTLLKFRSMYKDADERLNQVLESDPQRRREYEKYHKLQDDPRVTPIGEGLRPYSLDELPQLLNVIRGDMSLIGPRAYMPAELPDMKGLENVILQTPPGVTGLWQVSGRNQLGFETRIDLDVHYVQNWSLWLDLYLLMRTIPTVLYGEGAA